MNLNEILTKAGNIADQLGSHDRKQALAEIRRQLENQNYRVAFVGQFKTGKSTLINRFILKEDLLFTDVLEATSVPTELEYAEQPGLEVYEFRKAKASVQAEGATLDQDVVVGVDLAKTIPNPSTEIIRQQTSADTPEERKQLAQRVSHVRVFFPAANLRGFTVVDTPGINSTTEAVATTTYRVIPESDITILVASLKQLGEVELRLLQRHIFEAGITRCIVVLNYDSRFGQVNSSQVEAVRRAVKAQLEGIGRPQIPVVLAEASAGGQLPSGDLARKAAQNQPNDDWLNSSASSNFSAAKTSPGSPATEFEVFLLDYIRDNIRSARVEKIRSRTGRELGSFLASIEIELAALRQTETERASTLAAAQQAAKQSENDFQRLKTSFLADVTRILTQYKAEILGVVDEIVREIRSRLQTAGDLRSAQIVIEDAQRSVPVTMEVRGLEVAGRYRAMINDLQARYQVQWEEQSAPWREVLVQLNIKPEGFLGIVAKAPPFLVNVADILIFIVASPFPFFLDILLRMLAEKIPGLKDILPATLVKNLLVGAVQKMLQEQFNGVQLSIGEQIDADIEETRSRLQAAWEEAQSQQRSAVLEPLERASHQGDQNRAATLETAAASLRPLIAQAESAN
jgi:GTPase SAR1 family protein